MLKLKLRMRKEARKAEDEEWDDMESGGENIR